MKTRMFLVAVSACFALAVSLPAQSSGGKSSDKKQKSPADLAGEQFYKARSEAAAKPDQNSFQKMINAGLNWLTANPTDPRAPDVVRDLGLFGLALKEKNQAPLRASYVTQLKYEIVNQKFKDGITDDAKTALAAVDVAATEAETREAFTRPNLQAFREKIDALAQAPNSIAFLVPAERSYFVFLSQGVSPAAGEKHLRNLISNSAKPVADMAQEELNFVEMRKEPFAFKFTGIDGKEVDCAQFRGKVLAVAFWSSTNDNSKKDLEALREIHSEYKRNGFEVVTISYDKAEDKEKLTKAIQDMKLAWPVAFDGAGSKNELGNKLNVHRVPAIALFDQKGLLAKTGLRANRVAAEVRQLLGIKEEPREERSSGSNRRRR